MVYPVSRVWVYILFKIFVKRVKGIENIPNKAPFIVVSNHERLIEAIYIIHLIVKKLNKKVHFLVIPSRWYLGETICRKWAGLIPLFSPEQAYKEMVEYIKSGKIVGIFPEGYLKAKPRNPKTGAIRLAIETNTLILPLGIKSSYLPFNSTVNIGKLVYIKKSKTTFEEQIKLLMDYVYQLRDEIR
ncbi:1-acyl-sn-glycerol-3-phosphate acyltransferase [Candidatus Woesearchaeota archaeon]|nr:1-acyl-sn-glycerol-3-phosphate acyltransferase [Candidatus Woesearchaeota archaeon]